MSVAAAGRVFGVSRQTVSGWVNGFRRQGEASLAAGRRGRRAGEQQALPPWMQGQLVQTIRGRNPDQLRLPFFLWTREAVRELIRTRYGAELALTTVGHTSNGGGSRRRSQCSVRSSRTRSRSLVGWSASTRRSRREPSAKARGSLGRRDGPPLDQAAGRSFAPRGRTPVVGKTGQRFGCNVIQAVSNRGELCFRVFEGSFTQAVYCDFLKRLLKQAGGRKLYLIVDGHPVHRGKNVNAWLAERTELIEVHRLPGYSPAQPCRATQQRHQARRTHPAQTTRPRRAHRRHPQPPPPPPETTTRDPQLLPPPRRRLRSLTVNQLPAALVLIVPFRLPAAARSAANGALQTMGLGSDHHQVGQMLPVVHASRR